MASTAGQEVTGTIGDFGCQGASAVPSGSLNSSWLPPSATWIGPGWLDWGTTDVNTNLNLLLDWVKDRMGELN